jgi:hypothetical protein
MPPSSSRGPASAAVEGSRRKEVEQSLAEPDGSGGTGSPGSGLGSSPGKFARFMKAAEAASPSPADIQDSSPSKSIAMHVLAQEGDGDVEEDEFADVPHIYNPGTLKEMIRTSFAFMDTSSSSAAVAATLPERAVSAVHRSSVNRSGGVYARSPPKIQGDGKQDDDDDDESNWPQNHALPIISLSRPAPNEDSRGDSDADTPRDSSSKVDRGSDLVVDVTAAGVKVHVSPVVAGQEKSTMQRKRSSSSDEDDGPVIVPRVVVSLEQQQRQQQLKKAPVYISSSDDDSDGVGDVHQQKQQTQTFFNAAADRSAAASAAAAAVSAAISAAPDEAMKLAIAEEQSKGDAVDRCGVRYDL